HAPGARHLRVERPALPRREGGEGGLGHRPRLGQPGVHDLEGVAERPEGAVEDGLVLLGGERARGVDEGAAGPQRLHGAEEEPPLLRLHLAHLPRAPVVRRLGVVGAEAALGGAGGVEEDAVERLGLAVPVGRARAEDGEDAAGALVGEVRAELVEPGPHLLQRHDLPLVAHEEGQLAGLRAGRGAEVEHALARPGGEGEGRELARHVLDVDVALRVGERGEEGGALLASPSRAGTAAGAAFGGLTGKPTSPGASSEARTAASRSGGTIRPRRATNGSGRGTTTAGSGEQRSTGGVRFRSPFTPSSRPPLRSSIRFLSFASPPPGLHPLPLPRWTPSATTSSAARSAAAPPTRSPRWWPARTPRRSTSATGASTPPAASSRATSRPTPPPRPSAGAA